jgi:hypothetical protein
MKKAIFHSLTPYGILYTKKLVEEHGWEASYIFSVSNVYEDLKKSFPSAILHDFHDANKAIPPLEFKDMELDPIDPEWLNEFAAHESICMTMMERNDPWGTFRYKDRLLHYHNLIRYWSTVVRLLKPDYFVIEEEPHQVISYVLGLVGKKLGMKMITFIRVPFWRIYPVFDFREGSKKILECYNDKLKNYKGEEIILEEDADSYLNKMRLDFNIYEHNYNIKDGLNEMSGKNSLVKKILNRLFTFIKLFNLTKYPKRINFLLSLAKPAYHQDQKSRFGDFKYSKRSNLEYYFMLASTNRFKTKMKTYYDSLTNKEPDLNKPYIIYALHYQPEKTTSPQGDHFVNQLLAIDLIAKSLPEGWKLYVKEHPSQFIMSYIGDTIRSKKYYDDIVAIKNVELVPLIYDNYELIDKSKAVATITGTMSFEAVVRGIPSIVFGHVWYKECEGMMFVDSLKKMQEAIQKIKSGYKPDFYKIKLFAKSIEENSYRGFVGGKAEEIHSKISQAENGIAHLNAILEITNHNA